MLNKIYVVTACDLSWNKIYHKHRPVCSYPEKELAIQHLNLLKIPLEKFKKSQNEYARDVESLEVLKELDPNFRSSIYDNPTVNYEIVEIPFFLHVDQYLETKNEIEYF